MILELPNKDSYDEFLQFSKITEQNWLHPDRKSYSPFGMPKEQWINLFLEPQLLRSVPREVIQTFEVARACMIYSWFFYPLATLGIEQCMRVMEFAVRERCKLLGPDTENYYQNIQALVAAGIIPQAEEPCWQAARRLRNDRSHLNGYMLLDPGMAMGDLMLTATRINSLFGSELPLKYVNATTNQAGDPPPQPAP